jgi:hypothetical protein
MRLIRFIALLFIVLKASLSMAQVPAFDKLEMLYDQRHYKIVHRKANRLLDNPEYDFSMIPKYYKAISSLQLVQDQYWKTRHPKALEEAFAYLIQIKQSTKGKQIFDAHTYELASLRVDLESWISDLKRQNNLEEAKLISGKIAQLFDGIKFIEEPKVIDINYANNTDVRLKSRIEILEFAKKQLGVPYVSAGNNPTGFDCSGFTTYVFANYNVKLPRRAKDQYETSQKIKEKDAYMGDLIFFSNGTEISHVGMLINEPGKPKVMIHASSSKGISIVDIETSTYWKGRIVGYGRVAQ